MSEQTQVPTNKPTLHGWHRVFLNDLPHQEIWWIEQGVVVDDYTVESFEALGYRFEPMIVLTQAEHAALTQAPASDTNEAKRYKLQAAFWHIIAMNSTWRNITLGFEKGDFPPLFKELLSFAIMSGMGAGTWMDDDLDTEGLSEEEIAEHIEQRADCIPWSIVKECCGWYSFDPDPICNAYWEDIEEGLAQNRAFLAANDIDEDSDNAPQPT